jgi:hypothetical protein
MSATMNDDFSKKQLAFADALLACPKMAEAEDREQLLGFLPGPIQSRVKHFDDARGHVASIVRACADIEGGVKELLEKLKVFEGETVYWKAVEQAAQVLLEPTVEPDKARLVEVSGRDPKFALVIGISRYRDDAPPNQELQDHQFTRLRFAADDAQALHAFLRQQQEYSVEPLLLDEAATLASIRQALDNLRRKCKAVATPNPTVLIFFSGHGARDMDGRNYLVPHDARRDQLFGTAFWSEDFNNALDHIGTQRLVIFLDACQSGAIGAEGVKYADDPHGVAEDAIKRGRFVVASCHPEQHSYEVKAGEAKGYGVFANCLLELLRCDDPEAMPEDIDLWSLSKALETRVKEEAKPQTQVPFAPLVEERARSIVLAINQSKREARIRQSKRYADALRELLIPSNPQQKAVMQCRQPSRFCGKLTTYVDDGVKDAALEVRGFYTTFDEAVATGDPDDESSLKDYCLELIKKFDAAYPPPKPSDTSRSLTPMASVSPMPPQREPTPTSAAEDRVHLLAASNRPSVGEAGEIAGTRSVATLRMATSSTSVSSAEERRPLNSDDCRYVLAVFEDDDNMLLHTQARSLHLLLNQVEGVAKRDLAQWLRETDFRPVQRDEWDRRCNEIRDRFLERWSNATLMEPSGNSFALRASMDKRS